MADYGIPPELLPEVLPWPSVIGTVKPEVAELWGISPKVQLAMGGHDVNCAAVGAGVSKPGTACLISGSYENMLVMSQALPTPAMLLKGLSVMPHPGSAGYSVLKQEGVSIDRIRAVGGGARSQWWTQLKADLTGVSVEVVEQQEAGTLGAAILAGLAVGIYDDLEATARAFLGTGRIHEPDPGRAALYQDRLADYHKTVSLFLKELY